MYNISSVCIWCSFLRKVWFKLNGTISNSLEAKSDLGEEIKARRIYYSEMEKMEEYM